MKLQLLQLLLQLHKTVTVLFRGLVGFISSLNRFLQLQLKLGYLGLELFAAVLQPEGWQREMTCLGLHTTKSYG